MIFSKFCKIILNLKPHRFALNRHFILFFCRPQKCRACRLLVYSCVSAQCVLRAIHRCRLVCLVAPHLHQILRPTVSILGVLLFLKFGHFSCELKETGSLGGTESEVWIGNFNVKAWKTTDHKLHKIWPSLKILQNFRKTSTPRSIGGGGGFTYTYFFSYSCSFWGKLVKIIGRE